MKTCQTRVALTRRCFWLMAALVLAIPCVASSEARGDLVFYDNPSGSDALTPYSSMGEYIEFTPLANHNIVQVVVGVGLPATGSFDLSVIVEFYDDFNPAAPLGTNVYSNPLSDTPFLINPDNPVVIEVTNAPSQGLITSDNLLTANLNVPLPADGNMFVKLTLIDDGDSNPADPNTEANLLLSRDGVSTGSSDDGVYSDVDGNGFMEMDELLNFGGGLDNIRLTLSAAAVPEPSSVLFMLLVCTGMIIHSGAKTPLKKLREALTWHSDK